MIRLKSLSAKGLALESCQWSVMLTSLEVAGLDKLRDILAIEQESESLKLLSFNLECLMFCFFLSAVNQHR